MIFSSVACKHEHDKMSETHSKFADTSFSDVDRSDTDTSVDVLRKPQKHAQTTVNGSSSGPWVNSTDAYSKKLHKTNSQAQRAASKRFYIVLGLLGVGIFIVGVSLGIVIGRFAIKRPTENNNSEQFNSNGLQSSVSTTSPSAESLPTTTVQTCLCPTTQKPVTPVPSTVTTTTTTTCPTCTCSCPTSPVTVPTTAAECLKCSTRNPDISTGTESIASPFAPLTVEEMTLTLQALAMNGYVVANGNQLNVNRAAHMYLMPMEKSLVLNYLDNNGVFPGRFAKVHVMRGAVSPPDVMEFKVGPLNETIANIQIEQLRNDGEISFNRRPFDSAEISGLYNAVATHLAQIQNLLQESFDGAYYYNGILPSFSALPSTDKNDRLSAAFLYLRMGGYATIRIIPVTFIMHHPGTNVSQWYASDFYYASQGPFISGKQMQDAYTSGALRKFKLPQAYRDLHRSEFDPQFNMSLPLREFSDLPPPRTYEPKGPRYTIKGQRVRWMDWNFEFSSSPLHGPAIFDVRFKNQRIAYEISLQDVTLIYASQTNGAGPPAMSDTVYLLGSYNSPRLGLDCPDRASVLYASKFMYNLPQSMTRAACIFEADGQRPYWRHGSHGLVDHHLIIRASMNLGNYDYTLEWKFFLDGSLETLLSASGFLYGAFWDPDDPNLSHEKTSTPFGYRISDFQIGPIHDHNYLFKVDLDILGTNNSFQTVHWRRGSTLEAFQSRVNISSKPGFFYFNHTRFIEHEILLNENSFICDPLKPKYWTVVNENENNVWGNKRGYRVIPYSHSAEILQDHTMLEAWGHLKFMLAVTKQNHSEQYGTTSWYDLQYPVEPFRGVGRMLDNQTIRHEDLVLWISEKFLHAPTSEDLPMTLSVPSGFMLKPYNYFDRTPVFDVQSHYSTVSDPYEREPCYENIP